MSGSLAPILSIGFHGLAFAMVLYLISVGLSVTMGLMGYVNLAHGAFAMLGGYVMTVLMGRYGVPFLAALGLAAATTALVSIPLERSKAGRLLGYCPQTGLEEGLRKFVTWYRAAEPGLRA